MSHVFKGDSPALKPPTPAAPQVEEHAEQNEKAPAEGAACPRPRAILPPGKTVGRIEIPRLRIEAIVRSGVDDKTLGRAVGHVPQTALPGEPGNVGLAAHRDTFFRNLRDVKVGDRIRLTTADGSYEYLVESTKIVTPKNVEVLDPTPEPALTLVTCYPFNYIGHAPKRFIVRAKQLATEAAERTTPSTPEKVVGKNQRATAVAATKGT